MARRAAGGYADSRGRIIDAIYRGAVTSLLAGNPICYFWLVAAGGACAAAAAVGPVLAF